MNLFKNLFARIWALWGLVTFVITFLIIFPFSMISHLIKGNAGQHYFMLVSKIWIRCWLTLIACPLKVTGKNNFEKGKNYVITFNHNALLDVPLSAPFVPGGNKTIGKTSFSKVPIFGWFYKRGAILIDRNSETSRVRSYEEMKKVLALGLHMCIYPEGTRNRTNAPLKPFYDGAFKLAIDNNTPILPCVIIGTKKAMPIHKFFYLLPAKLSMNFLPPVTTANATPKELNKKVFDMMTTFYVANSN
jgi:1-acyl-sn-glycerol-3-phosphate acyltransferase